MLRVHVNECMHVFRTMMFARRSAISGASGPAPGPATMEELSAEVNLSLLKHSVVPL